ncbi:hypothetical protein J2Z21_009047 [Streptomyces griseochromogenes]|uniref:Uncharacterized protein n=1 Tax=Streptomyces griseochromogenes TaxID=68214 RepID=M1GVQ1_9ACTN|nr:hypothetical protein [Streptomyces griseochromogenes]AGE35600.1 hypothetical protein EX-BLS-2 [Streptomyces griseochromogenes]ANP51567.1 hypothetical protein AVL59_19920 [Streptomyces griseochromogenes]MBP2056030.1 hypothetical protein [Streptomyces griseochromogenes]
MSFNTARPVTPRLREELRNHAGDGRREGHGDGGGDFGGRRRPPFHPPDGPDPRRPPDPGPDTEDVAEGPFRVVRPADMLVVDISLVNLRFDGHRLVRRDPGQPAFVLAGLPPQHVREEVPPPLKTLPPVLAPMKSFTAGSTQLAFAVPANLDGLDLSLAALLDWARLVPLTVPAGVPGPDPPGSTVFQGVPRSVIEFPTRLLITYDEPVDWVGRTDPQQADGRAALWHARLHGAQDGEVLLRAFAAVRDRGPLPAGSPLTDVNLEDIVTLTSRAELTAGGVPIDVPSAPLHAEQFIVTPMGSSTHLHGAWQAPQESDKPRYQLAGRHFPDLEAYDHITGLGREQFIRVVIRGKLTSRHQAAHVIEFRRVFAARPNDGIVAYLQREDRVVVKEPEVQYGPENGFTFGGREMPFRALRITDRVTPVIRPPDPKTDPPPDPTKPIRDEIAFWVQLLSSGEDYEFNLIGTDWEGRKVSFTMPLVFVPDGLSNPEEALKNLYKEKPGRMLRQMRGQVMAMVQPPSDAPGSTCHAVKELTFGLGAYVSGQEEIRPVVGQLHVTAAAVCVPALEQFTPNAGDLSVTFNDTYLRQTLEKHPAGAYLNLKDPLPLTVGAEKAGGVASPGTVLKLITAQAGVVPDVFATSDNGAVVGPLPVQDIKNAFAGAQLLGGIDLSRFLKALDNDKLDTVQNLGDDQIEAVLNAADGLLPVPVLRIRDLVDGQGKELRYVWKTQLGKSDSPADILDAEGATLTLDARTIRSKDAADKATVEGRLSNFALVFADVVQVHMDNLVFKAGPGKKPDVTATGVELKFKGELEFIDTLRSALPADVFGAGAYVDIGPSGVTTGYKFALPAIPIGAFNLSNITLGAELKIPFDGDPVTFRFSVSEREHPFNVTVSLFGGGGYFSMLVDATGPRQIEGAIEFGGNAALNLGVASGGVSIMAGISFSLDDKKASVSGYLRCHGFLCVLGIVTVSVDFYLQLTYDKDKERHQSMIRGKGSLTVSVRIAFFSKSVSLELERSFSGAPGDPSFADCVRRDPDWREYCAAYAPAPVG